MAPPASGRIRRKWWIPAAVVLVLLGFGVTILAVRFESILKRQAIAMLSDRFHSQVEISDFHASIWNLQISGGGLVFRHLGRTDVPPLISIDHFFADADIRDLFGSSWRIRQVTIDGLKLQIPPREKRVDGPKLHTREFTASVGELVCNNAELVLLTNKPGKQPHVFEIHELVMRDLGLGRAASFHTRLRNPTPPGDIRAIGHFGPWNRDEPSATPVSADYTFSDANLSVFHGISGILSSTGNFAGPLDGIQVKGQTSTPDFSVTISGHKVQLSTDFAATVDGSDGDTLLHPVVARFGRSVLAASGGVVKTETGRREIKLHVTTDEGRLEDLLSLAVKTSAPPMTGRVTLNTDFDLPPGDTDLSQRLILNGRFSIDGGRFTRAEVRDKILQLSRRSLGKPKDEDAGSAITELSGRFTLKNGIIDFANLVFSVSGARVQLRGTYALRDESFNLHGKLLMQAKISQTTTGIKSVFLKAVDPFFRHNGQTEVPIKIVGTRDKPSFKLDL